MVLWLLIIIMMRGQTEYGYFVEKTNCEKVGKSVIKRVKKGQFKCKKIVIKGE